MGALADFIAAEFHNSPREEIKTAGTAKVANPAKAGPNFSKISNFSGGANLKTGQECCRCGEPATMGVGWFLRQSESARWFCGACVPVSGRA